ncbi:MAG: hypothetical protein U5J63_00495 [Fodinibius sp.]|nr:hypothetical protein [Fodinibius sp.]
MEKLETTGIDVQALFSAFEANNLGEILASPTIKVMDGQEGRIQVGQDFSIKQRDIAGNVVEKFFNVGTILTVTPQVITQRDTTFIHLDINAERSSAQPDPVSTVINKQQAQTQAILLDGEATVIAGLYNKEKTEVRTGSAYSQRSAAMVLWAALFVRIQFKRRSNQGARYLIAGFFDPFYSRTLWG